MTAQHPHLDIEPLVEYWQRDFIEYKERRNLWLQSLDDLIAADQRYELGKVRTDQELYRINAKLWNLIFTKIAIIPPRGNRCAGLALVHLVVQVASALKIKDPIAYDIIEDMYQTQGRRIPVQRGTSFRVVKSRLTT